MFTKNYTFKQITNNATLSQSLIDEFLGNRNCSTFDKHTVNIGNSIFTSETIVYHGSLIDRDKYINIGYARDKKWNHRIVTLTITDRHDNELFNYDSVNCKYVELCPTLLDMYQALFE